MMHIVIDILVMIKQMPLLWMIEYDIFQEFFIIPPY